MSAASERRDYLTTFCNQMHEVATGKPVNHACYILPTTALAAEMAGDYDKANEIVRAGALTRKAHSGVRRGRRRS